MEWLTPCVLVYTRRGYTSHFNTTGEYSMGSTSSGLHTLFPSLSLSAASRQLDPSVLFAETHQPRPVQSPATFTPLTLHELPTKGDLVGLDAEFVTLNQVRELGEVQLMLLADGGRPLQEEAEVKSDGTHTTLKPSQLSVARITVVRG